MGVYMVSQTWTPNKLDSPIIRTQGTPNFGNPPMWQELCSLQQSFPGGGGRGGGGGVGEGGLPIPKRVYPSCTPKYHPLPFLRTFLERVPENVEASDNCRSQPMSPFNPETFQARHSACGSTPDCVHSLLHRVRLGKERLEAKAWIAKEFCLGSGVWGLGSGVWGSRVPGFRV